jgi:hypothetical protein
MKALSLPYSITPYENIVFDLPLFQGVKQGLGVPVVCKRAGMLFKVHVMSNCYEIGKNSSEMWWCVTGYLIPDILKQCNGLTFKGLNVDEYYKVLLYYSLAPHVVLVDTSWCWIIQTHRSSSCMHITYKQLRPFTGPLVSYHFHILSSPDHTWNSAWTKPTSSIMCDYTTSLSGSHHYTQAPSTSPQLVHHPHQPCINQPVACPI